MVHAKRFSARAWPASLVAVVALVSFGAYLSTLAPTISWRHWGIDTGELATAAYRLAVPHPSGYPVYLLAGKLFTLLPLGEVAYRVNLMSAVFAALTVGATAWAIYVTLARTELPPVARVLAALVGAAMFAFSPTFWSQAVIAEVYTLHTFLLGMLVALLPRWQQTESEEVARWLFLGIVLVFGLSLGNHLTAVLAAPGLGMFLLLSRRVRQVLRASVWGVPVFVCSLTPYLLLVVRSSQGAWPSLWDASTPELLWDHVTGGPFKGLLFAFPVEIVLSRLSAAAGFVVQQYGLPGTVLAVAGVWFMTRRERPLAAFWLITGCATLLFALNYPVFDSQVYLLPFYLLLAVALGWGAAFLVPVLLTIRRLGHAAAVALLILPVLSFFSTRPAVDLSGDWDAYGFAKEALDGAAPNGLLLGWGPEETFALWYLQHAEGVHSDVMVVGAGWAALPQYQRTLQRRYGDAVPAPGSGEYLQLLIGKRAGYAPVYATPAAAENLSELVADRAGTLFQVRSYGWKK